MRTTTGWSIGCAGTWLLLEVLASAQAPSSLDDPEFGNRVATASGIQSFGTLFLIAAIILILITGYKNLFEKQTISVGGDYNEASYGSTIVTRSENVSDVRSTYERKSTDNSIFTAENIAHLDTIKAYLRKIESKDGDRAISYIEEAEKEIKYGVSGDQQKALGYISRAVAIVEKLSPAVGPIVEAIGKLKILF